jgi:Uncharacterised nucleotidyltransferase
MSEATKKLQERVARWNATGIAQHLWPEVPREQLEVAHDVLWRAVGDVLANRLSSSVALPNRTTTEALSIAATISGLGPLVGYWIEDGRVTTAAPLDELFLEHLDHGRRRASILAEPLNQLLAEFHRVGIDPILLKGAHTSRVYFPVPGTRPASDIDVLVHPDALPRARRALSAIGLVPSTVPQSPPHAEAWQRTPDPRIHAVNVDHAENPWQIDLHTSIDRSFFRGCMTRFGELPFDMTTTIDIDGIAARVLRHPLLVAHLAQHTARDFYRLRLVRTVELVLVIQKDRGRGLDFGELLAFLDGIGATRFMLPAFAFVERLVPGTVDPGFQEAITRAAPPRLRATVDAAFRAPLRGYFRRSPEERFMWSRGPLEWLQCVSDIVWPRGETFEERVWVLRRRARMLRSRLFGA